MCSFVFVERWVYFLIFLLLSQVSLSWFIRVCFFLFWIIFGGFTFLLCFLFVCHPSTPHNQLASHRSFWIHFQCKSYGQQDCFCFLFLQAKVYFTHGHTDLLPGTQLPGTQCQQYQICVFASVAGDSCLAAGWGIDPVYFLGFASHCKLECTNLLWRVCHLLNNLNMYLDEITAPLSKIGKGETKCTAT